MDKEDNNARCYQDHGKNASHLEVGLPCDHQIGVRRQEGQDLGRYGPGPAVDVKTKVKQVVYDSVMT